MNDRFSDTMDSRQLAYQRRPKSSGEKDDQVCAVTRLCSFPPLS